MPESFEEYVTVRGPSLLRLAYVLCGDHHLAEDIVQEVLVRVHRRWRRVSEVEQPEAYVRRAVVREFLSWRRRRASREITIATPPERRTADGGDERAERDEMLRLLARLPRSQRVVLVLRYYEDLPDDDIADVLGCAPATVRVHASRGIAKLRGLTTTKETHHEPAP
jgi:RNA polymerase sigma-70 factor (sigma-E family)